MLSRSMVRIGVALLVLCACDARVDAAQATDAAHAATGTINGVATDETGAPVSDVRVMVTNDATALRREVTSDAEGTFTLPLLPAGQYTLRAEREGFAPHEIPGIVVPVNEQVTIRVALKVDAVSEEVMVTARRREESQREVPLSLVAKTGEELLRAHVFDLNELERVVPGMLYGGLSVTATPSIFIRGVGSYSQSTGVDPSVGVAIDGVISARSSALAGELNDIEHVEVLRGPQGTLFGRNTSAGLVSIATLDPSETWTGKVEIGTGSYDEIKAKGTVSGPLIGHSLLGRLSFFNSRRDGYLTNLTTGEKILDDRQVGGRGTFVFRPGAPMRLRLSVYGLYRRNDWSHSLMPAYSLGPLSTPSEQLLNGIAGPTNTSVKTTGSGGIEYYTKTGGATLQYDHQLGSYALSSITAYQSWIWWQDWGNIGSTPAPFPFTIKNSASDYTRQWSQEVRLASPSHRRIDYVVGLYLYYLHFGNTLDQMTRSNETTTTYNNSLGLIDTHNYAGFGEANVRATKTLTLIAGTRWTHETKDFFSQGLPAPPGTQGVLVSSQPGITTDTALAENWSWRFGARWEPAPAHMLYASAARGFKGPGFNNLSAFLGVSQKLRPEVATTFEVGSKSAWFDGRLSTNLSVYHSRFVDMQAQGFAPVSLPIGIISFNYVLTNAGKLRTRGAELEVQGAIADGLTVNLTSAYIDAIFEDFRGAQCYTGQAQFGTGCINGQQDLTGTRLPLTPKFSGSLGLGYERAMGALPIASFVRADYSWRSAVQYSTANAPGSIEPAYGLLGATFGVHSKDGRYTVSVYGKNLTDKFHVSGLGILAPGGYGTTLMQIGPDYRRTWGTTFSVNF
jgi:iron complex outermembrane recepter protein